MGSRVLTSIQVLVFLLLDPENALSEELLPSIIGAMFAGFFGVLIGTRIAGKVDQKMFNKVLQSDKNIYQRLIIFSFMSYSHGGVCSNWILNVMYG